MMISVCINVDTRQGYKNELSTVGDYGHGSLQGVRSMDLLIDGVKNKMNYFRGYNTQCILYIDKHEELSEEDFTGIKNMIYSFGNNSVIVFKSHNRTKDRWYDYIPLECLKLAKGDYVVHFDGDANAFRSDESGIIEKYIDWLDNGYKYICQPTDLTIEQHGMFWASTRFFICKKETLDLPLIERSLYTPFMGKHTPCLEHVLGVIAGEGKVLYPPREDDKYIVFSWARYYTGTLKKLNKLPYNQVIEYILDCGLHGANDVLDKN